MLIFPTANEGFPLFLGHEHDLIQRFFRDMLRFGPIHYTLEMSQAVQADDVPVPGFINSGKSFCHQHSFSNHQFKQAYQTLVVEVEPASGTNTRIDPPHPLSIVGGPSVVDR